jgi:hypothetical protein
MGMNGYRRRRGLFALPRPYLQAFRELAHLSEAALLLSACIGSRS